MSKYVTCDFEYGVNKGSLLSCDGAARVLGAIMFTLIGFVFLKADMKPSLDQDLETSAQGPQGEVVKNILMGFTMSGINPALLASYTGAIASGSSRFAAIKYRA